MRLLVSFLAFAALGAAQPTTAPLPASPSAAQAPRAASLRDFSVSLEQLSRRVSRGVVQIFSSGYTLERGQ